MMQAASAACIVLLRMIFQRGISRVNSRCIDTRGSLRRIPSTRGLSCAADRSLWRSRTQAAPKVPTCDYPPKKRSAWQSKATVKRALRPLSVRMGSAVPAPLRKQAGVLGVRCSLGCGRSRLRSIEFIRLLKQTVLQGPRCPFRNCPRLLRSIDTNGAGPWPHRPGFVCCS